MSSAVLRVYRCALLLVGAVGLLAGCPGKDGGAEGSEDDSFPDECVTGGEVCCALDPGSAWCQGGSGSTTWVGDGADNETYLDECASDGGDCCDPFCDTTGTGTGTGGCLCFETTEFMLIDSCERPLPCGFVKLPSTDEDDNVQPLTPEEETTNVAAIGCFLDAIADGQPSVIQSDRSVDGGFHEYRRTVIAEESGDGVTWEHWVEDLVETITPVVYTYGITTLTTCSDVGDSVAQWDCITAALAERGTAGPSCTAQLEFEPV